MDLFTPNFSYQIASLKAELAEARRINIAQRRSIAGERRKREQAEAELRAAKIALEQAWQSNREREAELVALRAAPRHPATTIGE